MKSQGIYPSFYNPYLIETKRPMPDEMAVIGAGHIGPDIAFYLRTGLPERKLFLVDIEESQLKNAKERHRSYTEKGIKLKKMTPEKAEKILGNIVYTTDYSLIRNCGLVIEAATENLELKKKIFNLLEDITSKEAILTSNTSGIPAHDIFGTMKHPERSTITHFFAPAWRSLPVEVINWEKVSPEILSYLLRFFALTGKVPMMTANVFSFLLNRIFENWTNEASYLLNRATTAQIDRVAEEFAASGPFFVMNYTGGNPLVYESQLRRVSERECYAPSPILVSVDSWKVNRPGTEVDVPRDLREWIRYRLLGLLFSQCFDITDRDIGTRSDLNLGCILGLAFKKGPFELMADMGEDEVKRIFEKFSKERKGFPLPTGSINRYIDFPRDILVDDMDGVRIITIRRPQAANALSRYTCSEILGELKKGEKDPSVKGFIITGYGTKAFCAGADINEFIATLGNYDAGRNFSQNSSLVIEHINRMNKPVVAALNGLAMGGGAELAMACHSMVADKRAFLKLPEITLGIVPGMGGAVIPYRKWPGAFEKFHAMITQAEPLTSDEGKNLGMFAGITDNYLDMIHAAGNEVDRLAGNIPRIADAPVNIPEYKLPEDPKSGDLELSREALTLLAKIINEGSRAESFSRAMDITYQVTGEISCLDASREGIFAFLEKRKPVFKKL